MPPSRHFDTASAGSSLSPLPDLARVLRCVKRLGNASLS